MIFLLNAHKKIKGGKVAMAYAHNKKFPAIDKLIVVDIAPVPNDSSHIIKYLHAMDKLNLDSVMPRERAAQLLQQDIHVLLFLVKCWANLFRIQWLLVLLCKIWSKIHGGLITSSGE